MKKTIKATVYTFAFLAASYATASAFPANMVTAGATSQPIGHYEYCKANRAECGNISGSTSPVHLTEDNWKTILKVNYTVNTNIQPMTDMQLYGVEEKWAVPTVAGDCEDFALLKRKLLMQSGISASDLPMTVVLQPNGEGHAVLTVRTDRGDFILDNMRNRVLLWSQTEYRFLKRQSDSNSAKWVKIDDGHDVVVGSVR
jgi:predicted transglutaminase-like cysteine proteinase